MRDARASASVASASETRARARAKKSRKIAKITKKSRKIAKNREIANGTRLLAHRSRSLRSRIARASRKIQVRRHYFSFFFFLFFSFFFLFFPLELPGVGDVLELAEVPGEAGPGEEEHADRAPVPGLLAHADVSRTAEELS